VILLPLSNACSLRVEFGLSRTRRVARLGVRESEGVNRAESRLDVRLMSPLVEFNGARTADVEGSKSIISRARDMVLIQVEISGYVARANDGFVTFSPLRRA
jgi:hypothetical protein